MPFRNTKTTLTLVAALGLLSPAALALPLLGDEAPNDPAPGPERCTATTLLDHPPILIEGDGAFTAANGVVAGSGTAEDPYLICGWAIRNSPVTSIELRNTSAHVRIENNLIKDQYLQYVFLIPNGYDGERVTRHRTDPLAGIKLSGAVSNVAIVGNVIENIGCADSPSFLRPTMSLCTPRIAFPPCPTAVVTCFTDPVAARVSGILFWYSGTALDFRHITIERNRIVDVDGTALYLSRSTDLRVKDNTIEFGPGGDHNPCCHFRALTVYLNGQDVAFSGNSIPGGFASVSGQNIDFDGNHLGAATFTTPATTGGFVIRDNLFSAPTETPYFAALNVRGHGTLIEGNVFRDIPARIDEGGSPAAGSGLAIRLLDSAGAEVHGNDFLNTSGVHSVTYVPATGGYVDGYPVNAQDNYWGCPAGPNAGAGCGTTNAPVAYTPWATAPYH